VKKEEFENILEDSLRLDKFLDSVCEDISRSFIKKLIKNSSVKVNGEEIAKPGFQLKLGDKVEIIFPEPKDKGIKSVDLNLEVIHEDSNILIINKPSGLVVHPGAGVGDEPTMVNGIMYIAKDLSGIGGELRPGIVHRLDKETSGLILVCKNDSAHKFYAKKFKDREMKKKYMVLVYNVPEKKKGLIESDIGRSPLNRVMMASSGIASRHAVTNYSVLEELKYFSVIEASPHTGRTHQIRVHLSENNMPVMGDKTYQDKNIINNIWTIYFFFISLSLNFFA